MTPKQMPSDSLHSTSEQDAMLRSEKISSQAHLPVLYHEIILALRPRKPGRYVDATLGAGGHARGILEACSPDGCLLGMDVDSQALTIASSILEPFGDRAILVQSSYIHLTEQVHRAGWDQVDGVLIDLGVSSMQLDTPARGFSFLRDGNLDMRFDPRQKMTAADLVNQTTEVELAEIIWKFGEERDSRKIARAIVHNRPVLTTRQLAEIVAGAIPGRTSRIHPATKTFQAIRIAVNSELEALQKFLPQAIAVLKPGGRLAAITFHSLEDRIAKQYFRQESRDCICPPERPICTCGHKASIVEINRHPIMASVEEIESNPRSRSARLRVVEKL
jgi:16S rRNA (cytosine1402-N4)-methyltransferase